MMRGMSQPKLDPLRAGCEPPDPDAVPAMLPYVWIICTAPAAWATASDPIAARTRATSTPASISRRRAICTIAIALFLLAIPVSVSRIRRHRAGYRTAGAASDTRGEMHDPRHGGRKSGG